MIDRILFPSVAIGRPPNDALFESRVEADDLALGPRLVAARWFAIAACVPVAGMLVPSLWNGGSLTLLNLIAILCLVEPAVAIAAVLGFTVGSRIVDAARPTTVTRSAARGALVAVLSYLLYAGSFVVVACLKDLFVAPRLIGQDAEGVVFVFAVGAVLVGWLVIVAGAVAGGLLYVRSDFQRPRVNIRTSRRWIVSAWLCLVLNHVVFALVGLAVWYFNSWL